MADENDKLTAKAIGHAMRFLRNADEYREDTVEVESVDASEDEIELAFTLKRDRYYLRMRRDDVRRLLDSEQ